MILASCYVKVALNCGAEDAELLAREIGVKSQDIQSLKPYEAYIGSGKKPHKVLTFPGPDVPPYKPKPAVKRKEIDFLGEGWVKV
jgi:hypothetical protein